MGFKSRFSKFFSSLWLRLRAKGTVPKPGNERLARAAFGGWLVHNGKSA